MPVYAYRCQNCGHQFEEHQSFEDPPLTVCPACKQASLRKLIQPVGIVFKGSGFYVTDNRSKTKGRDGRSTTSDRDNGKAAAESEAGSDKQDKSTADSTESAKDSSKVKAKGKTTDD